MAVKGAYIADLTPLASPLVQLPGGLFEVEVLAGPVAGAYVTRQLTTEQLVTYLGAGLGPNAEKSLVKEFRFFRKADRDADSYGGACFETDLDWATCCAFTVCKIEFYRENDTDPFRYQELECVFDPAPTDPTHLAWVDGSFSGLRNPCKFVPVVVSSGGTTLIRLDIAGAQALLTNTPPADQVQEAAWYTIDGDWNATGNDTRVWVWGLSKDAFSPVGIFRDGLGELLFVEVDVVAGTTALANGKLYDEPGVNTDGAMTQRAATEQVAQVRRNRLYRAGQEVVLATDDELNTSVQDGDEVHLRSLVQLASLTLKSATYYTYGLPHRLEFITDGGQSVRAKMLGGMSPRADARRTVSLSGAGTQVTMEADLHLISNAGNSVTLASSAELRHTGLLSAYGSGAMGAVLADSSRYYHAGRSTFGGSLGLKMSGNSYAEMRETEPARFNFRPALVFTEQAQADWYGGIHLEPGTSNAGSQIAQLSDNSLLRLRTGRYDNASALAFALQNTATVEVSSAVTVEAPAGLAYGPPNTNLLRHAGGQLSGSLAGGIVIAELASDLPSTGGTAYIGGEGIEVNGNVIKATGFGGLRADLSVDASGAVAWDAGGHYQDFRSLRLDDNATLQLPTNVPAGGSGFLRVLQGGLGGKTLAAPAGATSQVPAAFGVNSTPNMLVGLVGYVFDGTNFYWNVTRYN